MSLTETAVSDRNRPAALPRTLLAAMVRRWLAFRYRLVGRRYGRLVLEELDGVHLLVLPDVFNPVLLRTGAFNARALARQPISARTQVLDLGTGSGIGAIFAARRGASVTAVDINPEAVRCARINALLNRVEDHVDVRQGDLFEPVTGERYDLVLFNPPFHRGKPESGLDHAWKGQTVFERFTSGLEAALSPGGRALITLSTDGDGHLLLELLRGAGFAINVVAARDLINEQLSMHEVRLPADQDG